MKYKIKGKFEELKNILEVKLRAHLSRVQTVPRASTPHFVFANLPRALNTQYILKRAN